MKSLVFALFCIALVNQCHSQDTLSISSSDTLLLKKTHSAKKATILSALAPGIGQIYNRKIWKAPIVWGGLGTCIYFISDNRNAFRLYKDESVLRQNDPDHVSTLTYNSAPDRYKFSSDEILPDAELSDNLDKRKRWLDLSYFALVAVYGLNIIDANVDGHLFQYDISPDISMRIAPSPIFSQSPKAGLSLTLNF